MLNNEGILIFSTLGAFFYNLYDEQGKNRFEKIFDGFFYGKLSETTRLSNEDYGTAIVYPDFVENFVSQNNCGKLLAFYPKKLFNLQDVYVIMKCESETPIVQHQVVKVQLRVAKKQISELSAKLQETTAQLQAIEKEIIDMKTSIVGRIAMGFHNLFG